ncbi:unnamed protein product [Symbiodinium natans]|uniref:J domain-containing protein n=1 Tax=Symbiodinium natans TaxID=878477 RepID=A0A812SRI1_9DINO|nr:unnamed protein product [Symbiodinium natans]
MGALKLVPFLALHAHVAARDGGEPDEDPWFRCTAEAWFDRPSRGVHVPLWVRGRRAKRFLSGGPNVCMLLAEGVTGEERCEACRWFDISDPGALSKPGFGQVAANISADECADGTWSDEASAWLRRDELVHRQKYVGACLVAESDDDWTLQATYVAWAALAASCCYVLSPTFRRCRLRSADDSEEEPPRRREPPWMPPKQRRPFAEEPDSPSGSSPSPSRGLPPLDLSAPMPYGPTAASIILSIDKDLADKINAPEDERKRIMRKYLMRWHPDKNQEESKETTTAVIQHLYARKAWFLEGAARLEVVPLLP